MAESEYTGLDRIPSDKELYSIAGNIGHGWQMLAVYLGIDHTQVDQIEQDYRSTLDRIFRLLVRWKQLRADGATLRELFYQMHHTGHGLNWSRDGIATSLKLMESDIRDCKNARTQRDYTDYGGKPSVPNNPENKPGKSNVGVVQPRPEGVVSNLRGGQLSLIDRRNQRSNRPPKETCIYDGRLILLSDEDHEQIKRACTSQNVIGKGGFGIVYKQTNQGLGITVAIKKITADSEEMKNSARREMYASRIQHPFILPLLATFEERVGSHSEIYFISPYCENGDLYGILKECRDNKNPDSCRVWLSQTQRIRIILQVAIAIQYLHTPVKDVRYFIFPILWRNHAVALWMDFVKCRVNCRSDYCFKKNVKQAYFQRTVHTLPNQMPTSSKQISKQSDPKRSTVEGLIIQHAERVFQTKFFV